MERVKNIAQHVAEYLLIAVYILAAIGEVSAAEPSATGILGWLFSDPIAAFVYATWFVVMALALLGSKIWRKHKLHKYALAGMYLTTVYTISLAVALFGWGSAAVIDDGVIGAVAAACWLRWKLKTEYVNLNDVVKDELDEVAQ